MEHGSRGTDTAWGLWFWLVSVKAMASGKQKEQRLCDLWQSHCPCRGRKGKPQGWGMWRRWPRCVISRRFPSIKAWATKAIMWLRTWCCGGLGFSQAVGPVLFAGRRTQVCWNPMCEVENKMWCKTVSPQTLTLMGWSTNQSDLNRESPDVPTNPDSKVEASLLSCKKCKGLWAALFSLSVASCAFGPSFLSPGSCLFLPLGFPCGVSSFLFILAPLTGLRAGTGQEEEVSRSWILWADLLTAWPLPAQLGN